MKFTIEINMDNAAMQNDSGKPDWASINQLIYNLRMEMMGEVQCPDKGIIRDHNGNKVGTWEVTE